MTKILILTVILVFLYLYWKNQQKPVLKSEKINSESSQFFWDAQDFELGLNNEADSPTKEIPTEQKDWFTPQHWLTDQEIDWACEQILDNLPLDQAKKYQVLESTQFMFLANVSQRDKDALEAFPMLLSELTNPEKELVFIPVNNPDFHWSLLVYETATKTFHHYDSLRGANYGYIKPLVQELLAQIHPSNTVDLKPYLLPQHKLLKQTNSWDCGVAVLTFVQKIIQENSLTPDFTNTDLTQEWTAWRNRIIPTHD